MASKLAEAYVRARLDTDHLRKDMRRTSAYLKGAVQRLGNIFKNLLSPLRLAIVSMGAGYGLYRFLRTATRLALEQEQAERKLAAVLRATGGAAGYSAEELRKFASDLQNVTNYGDETTIAMMSVLATFKEIQGPMFKRAVKAVLDMSTVFGTELRMGAIQVGKALQMPIQGMTALTRAGVTFTDQQKEQVKLFVETGRLAEAQTLILVEMEGQFKGMAEALADPMIQFKNALGDVGEVLGTQLLPFLRVLANEAKAGLGGLQVEADGATRSMGGAANEFGIFGAAVLSSADAIQEFRKIFMATILGLADIMPWAARAISGLPDEEAFEAALERIRKTLQEMEGELDWSYILAQRVREVRRQMDDAREAAKKLGATLGGPELTGGVSKMEDAIKELREEVEDFGKTTMSLRLKPFWEEFLAGGDPKKYAEAVRLLEQLDELEAARGRKGEIERKKAGIEKMIEPRAGVGPTFTALAGLSQQIQRGIMRSTERERELRLEKRQLDELMGINKGMIALNKKEGGVFADA